MGAIGLPGDLSVRSRGLRSVGVYEAACPRSRRTASRPASASSYHILGAVAQQRGCCALADGEVRSRCTPPAATPHRGIYYYKTYENGALTAVSLFREDLEGRVPVSYALETELRVRWSN